MIHSSYYFLLITLLYAAAFIFHLTGRHIGLTKGFLGAGLLMNGLFLIFHFTITGVYILNSLVDPPFFIPFVISAVLLFLPNKIMTQRAVSFGLLFLVLTVLFAAFYPKGTIPPAPNKSGVLPFLFFLTENAAYAFFGLSAVLSIFPECFRTQRRIIRRLVVLGFILFSFAQVEGAAWSFLGWGHPFMWGSRHLGSAGVWLIYAALIHMRFLASSSFWERILTAASGGLAMFTVYGHLIFEMGIPRLGA